MYVDGQATKTAPQGWTIWRTPTRWQAIRDDEKMWGPMRRSDAEAVADAEAAHKRDTTDDTR